MSKLGITIRMNAGENSVTADGHVFDRSTMTFGEKAKLRRLVVQAWEKTK